MNLAKFISEIKRRNVIRAILAYLAVAWVIVQIAFVVIDAFTLPDYSKKIVFYILSIGLVIWVVFSWAYDLTSEGFRKTEDITNKQEVETFNRKRLNTVIIGALSLAVVLLIVLSFWAGSLWNQGLLDKETTKVAVIPFEIENVDQEEYFKSGMTDGLIEELSKTEKLTILSQASTKLLPASFSTASMLMTNEMDEIEYFVTGSLDLKLNRLTIDVQLKEAIEADPIWEKTYSDDLTNVKRLWAGVADDIERQMGIVVPGTLKVDRSSIRAINPETYSLYLKGKYNLSKSTPSNWLRGMVYLQEAVDKNPGDTYAWSGLAEGYVMIGHGPNPPLDVFPKAYEAAMRAIQLDSMNAEGWAALAHYHTYFGWDWDMAEYAFNRANELNPNMAYNHYHRAWYLVLFGRINEALIEHKRAQELDPFTPLHTAWLGEIYRLVGEYEKGLAEVEKVEHMDDDFALGLLIKGNIQMDQEKVEEGLKNLKAASKINPDWKYLGYGPALIRAGKLKEGKAIIEELENKPTTPYGALCLGIMYNQLGDLDKAIECWSYKDKHGWYPWIRVLMWQKEIIKDPRYLELIREMGLPDPAPFVYEPEK
ncbi:tetratricopeptide repeat protein [Aegicerativicinus sediminis]|uniref:tetratricopeptide repeat protein n=1 Tax=Aegicerativicinus sediminis TaxID=2893202 RepID=UPI001E6363D4|nr:hypothetical protein [Aegicerativicinus sediminis]